MPSIQARALILAELARLKRARELGRDQAQNLASAEAWVMPDLPLDPHDCPWTSEYQELHEERARRAYILREAMMEDDEFNCRRPHH